MITPANPRRPHLRWLFPSAFAFYALTAFLILHPILFTTGTHSAGFDYFNYHWNFWWLRFAPSMPDLSVYATNFTMFPYTTNLGYHALTAFWFPLWALTEPLIGTLAAMNLIIVIACTLNGWLMFALLRREGAAPAAALLGGLALQAAPNLRYFYYNTHINLMDWFWLPALLLIWGGIAALVERRQHAAAIFAGVGFGAALWGLALTDLQFPIFAAFLLVPYGLLTLVRARQRILLIGVGLVGVIVGGALLWFAGPLPHMLTFEGTLAPGTVEDRPGIPIPDGFLRMNETWWEWAQPSIGAWITLIVIGAVVIGLRARAHDRRWFWLALMLPPLIFALGPTLTIAGQTIPLPFRLLHAQTDGMFRMPWRLAPIAIIAGLTFAALAFTPFLTRSRAARGWIVTAALLLLAIDVRFFESAPLAPLPPQYAFYDTIGAETGTLYDDQVIIEIPTGAASGEVIFGDPRATQLQWYTLDHRKRIVNGFISRAPLEHFYYLETGDPMLSWLGQRRYLEPEAVAAQMRERIDAWQIGYFVMHRDLIGVQAPAVQEIIGFFNQLDDLVCPFAVEGDAVVYRTTWHPDGCPPRTPPSEADGTYSVDVGAADDVRHLGWGWHYAEDIFGTTLRWAGDRPTAEVYIDLPPGAYTIEIIAQAYATPRVLTVSVNGTTLDESALVTVDSLRSYRFVVGADRIGDGVHSTLTITYDDWIIPADSGGGDQRRLAIAVDAIRFIPTPAQ